MALVGRLREELTGADELLGIEEVARLLGVGQVTVWRWCREGALPCAKIGRKWRVRRGALDEFVRRSERAQTLTGRLRVFVGVRDILLAVTQDAELMRKLDPAFLRVGEARGGVLVKYQLEDERLPSLDDLREELRADGMDVGRLEGEGRLRLIAGSAASGGRPEEVRRLVAEVSGELGDGRTVWVNFNWDMGVGLEAALRQQRDLSELVEGESDLVVKTTVLEDMDGWPGAEQRRAQVAHSGMVWLSHSGLVMSRVLPPPVLRAVYWKQRIEKGKKGADTEARNGSPNGAGAVRRTAGWHHHTWWIIASERAGGRLEALTVRRPDGPREEALAVFDFAEEAGLYLRLGALEGDGWRVRESGPGEVASVLLDPCAGAKRVALDPLPETAADGRWTW